MAERLAERLDSRRMASTELLVDALGQGHRWDPLQRGSARASPSGSVRSAQLTGVVTAGPLLLFRPASRFSQTAIIPGRPVRNIVIQIDR